MIVVFRFVIKFSRIFLESNQHISLVVLINLLVFDQLCILFILILWLESIVLILCACDSRLMVYCKQSVIKQCILVLGKMTGIINLQFNTVFYFMILIIMPGDWSRLIAFQVE